jgi:hypothetical protein
MSEERLIICDNCGELLGSEPVDAEGDDSDVLVPPEECPFCGEEDE